MGTHARARARAARTHRDEDGRGRGRGKKERGRPPSAAARGTTPSPAPPWSYSTGSMSAAKRIFSSSVGIAYLRYCHSQHRRRFDNSVHSIHVFGAFLGKPDFSRAVTRSEIASSSRFRDEPSWVSSTERREDGGDAARGVGRPHKRLRLGAQPGGSEGAVQRRPGVRQRSAR